MQSLEEMHKIINALSDQEMTLSQFIKVHEKVNINISKESISKAKSILNEINLKTDHPFLTNTKFFNKLKEQALLCPDEKGIADIISYITHFFIENAGLEDHYYIVNLRLKGARSFLHPPFSQLSPLVLGGLYTHILFLMRSLCSSFLYKINVSPFFELATTLARSNLIIPGNAMETALQEVENLSRILRNRYPFLSLEIHSLPALKNRLETNEFLKKTILSNQTASDKVKEKSGFINETNTLPLSYYEKYSQDMLTKHDPPFIGTCR